MMQKEDSLTHAHKLSNGNQYDVSPAPFRRRRQVLKCRSIRHVLNERSERGPHSSTRSAPFVASPPMTPPPPPALALA